MRGGHLDSVHPQLSWLSCFSTAERTKRDRETFAESYCSSIKQATKSFSVSLVAGTWTETKNIAKGTTDPGVDCFDQ